MHYPPIRTRRVRVEYVNGSSSPPLCVGVTFSRDTHHHNPLISFNGTHLHAVPTEATGVWRDSIVARIHTVVPSTALRLFLIKQTKLWQHMVGFEVQLKFFIPISLSHPRPPPSPTFLQNMIPITFPAESDGVMPRVP